jgi:hypothetical protein
MKMEPLLKKCKDCGETFSVSVKMQEKVVQYGHEVPERCEFCRERRKMNIQKTCRDCGTEFFMSQMQEEYYIVRGLVVPVRCDDCRKIKRESNGKYGYDKR